MQLEHINLVVSDMEAMISFYAAAFPHWRIRGSGKGDWYGKPRTWLHFGDDHHYIALSDHGEGDNRDLKGDSIGLAHFGYVVDDLSGVMARLALAGYAPAKDGAGECARTNVYYIDPAGFEVEFVQYHTDVPAIRNQYAA